MNEASVWSAVESVGVPTALLIGLCVVLYRIMNRAVPLAGKVVESHLAFLQSQADTNKRLEELLEQVVAQIDHLDQRIERLERTTL